MLYKFDPYKFALQLLPPLLHSPVILAILKAFCSSIRGVSETFAVLRQQTKEEMGALPSVLMLEDILNRTFHLNSHQICVTSVEGTDDVFWYHDIEADSGYHLDRTYLFFSNEQQSVVFLKTTNELPLGDDITIHIPNFMATSTDVEEDEYDGKNLSVIKLVVEKYKPAGKNYGLEIYRYE